MSEDLINHLYWHTHTYALHLSNTLQEKWLLRGVEEELNEEQVEREEESIF
jgi:hypothetical protein